VKQGARRSQGAGPAGARGRAASGLAPAAIIVPGPRKRRQPGGPGPRSVINVGALAIDPQNPDVLSTTS